MAKRAAPDGKNAAANLPSLAFTIEVDGERPRKFRIAPGKRAVKVGRGPKNDIVLGVNGISAHHLDLLALDHGQGPTLAVRDVSTNGTCIVSAPGGTPLKLAKDTEIEVLNSSLLLLPFKVKPNGDKQPDEMRVTMKVTVSTSDSKKKDAIKKSKKSEATTSHTVGPSQKMPPSSAEEMMARCRAFAEEMERKKTQGGARNSQSPLLTSAIPAKQSQAAQPCARSATEFPFAGPVPANATLGGLVQEGLNPQPIGFPGLVHLAIPPAMGAAGTAQTGVMPMGMFSPGQLNPHAHLPAGSLPVGMHVPNQVTVPPLSNQRWS